MTPAAKPILKWAGGKTQMLPVLSRYLPQGRFRYIEPMIGGGAMFFALSPERAIIADSNPELINLYRTLVGDLDGIVEQYEAWRFDEAQFYDLRSLRFEDLAPTVAAARTIFLNRSCFNGLYRVNRSGAFNVPWGRYKRPYRIDRENFKRASEILARADIVLGDFREVLRATATCGDFVFLDPPYVPISAYSDFKRYTATQFGDHDHIEMAALTRELADRGCRVLITNSNHPLVHDLYRGYQIEVVATKRNVNSRGNGRTGEDVVIYANGS
jgi:DNA adenine methylase